MRALGTQSKQQQQQHHHQRCCRGFSRGDFPPRQQAAATTATKAVTAATEVAAAAELVAAAEAIAAMMSTRLQRLSLAFFRPSPLSGPEPPPRGWSISAPPSSILSILSPTAAPAGSSRLVWGLCPPPHRVWNCWSLVSRRLIAFSLTICMFIRAFGPLIPVYTVTNGKSSNNNEIVATTPPELSFSVSSSDPTLRCRSRPC